MYDIASSTSQFYTFVTNFSTYIGVVLGSLLVILAALLGLGFGIRHVKKWITGKKA